MCQRQLPGFRHCVNFAKSAAEKIAYLSRRQKSIKGLNHLRLIPLRLNQGKISWVCVDSGSPHLRRILPRAGEGQLHRSSLSRLCNRNVRWIWSVKGLRIQFGIFLMVEKIENCFHRPSHTLMLAKNDMRHNQLLLAVEFIYHRQTTSENLLHLLCSKQPTSKRIGHNVFSSIGIQLSPATRGVLILLKASDD